MKPPGLASAIGHRPSVRPRTLHASLEHSSHAAASVMIDRGNRPDSPMTLEQSKSAANPDRPRRERSTRYPGVGLAESLRVCEPIEELGVDGLAAAGIASALGYTNIKTNTFSARLSAARQFGLLRLAGNGYTLTPLAREILHPLDPAEVPRLLRQALLRPSLYA